MIINYNKYIKENSENIITIGLYSQINNDYSITIKDTIIKKDTYFIDFKNAYFIFIQLILYALKNNYKYTLTERYYHHLVINFYYCKETKLEILNKIKITTDENVYTNKEIIINIIENILKYDIKLYNYYVINDLLKYNNITKFDYLKNANKFDLL